MWTRIVSVRETEATHLGIVFEDEAGEVVTGEMGRLEESMNMQQKVPGIGGLESNLRRRVIPGKKYGTLSPRASNIEATQAI